VDCTEVVASYLALLNSEFSCTELAEGQALLQTPYTFSDGDAVEVVLSMRDSWLTLSDAGEALGRLALSGVNLSSEGAEEHISSTTIGYRVTRLANELRGESRLEDGPDLLLRLTAAMLAIDGLQVLRPSRRTPQFSERLASYLASVSPDVEKGFELRGRSGAVHRFTAHIGGAKPLLIQGVAGGTSEAGTRSVEHAFTMFSDLNSVYADRQRKLAVLSDDERGWRPAHVRLLRRVALVADWRRREPISQLVHGGQLSDEQLFELTEQQPL
jgi:hypothetical protein